MSAPVLQAATIAQRWTWTQRALLGVALALALFVRIGHLDAMPSFDELWHLRLSAANGVPLNLFRPDQIYFDPVHPTSVVGAPPVWKVWAGMDGVLHPPLYVTTLRLWRDLLGDGNVVVQAYSIAWSLVAIAFTFAAARLAMGGTAAFLVGVGMALAPTQVFFAQEMRAYAMLSGLTAICAWLMTRIELFGPTRGRAVALAAMTLPLLLTHYFAFGTAIGIAIYGCWRLRGRRGSFLVALAGAAAIYVVAWLPFAVQQLDDIGTGDVSWKVARHEVWRLIPLVANAPFRLIADRKFDAEPTSLAAAVLFVMPWMLVRRLRPLAPWAILLSASVICIAALDAIRSTQVVLVTRYLVIASPAAFLLFAGCGWAIDRRAGAAVATCVAIMGGIYLYARVPMVHDVQSFGEVAVELKRRAKPGEPLAVYCGKDETFYGDTIFSTVANAGIVPRGPYLNMSGPISPENRALLGPRLWLVSYWHEPTPEQLVPGSRVLFRKVIDLNAHLYYLAIDAAASETSPATGPAAVP